MVARGLVAEFINGPKSGVRIDLVGDQNLMISGDKVKMEVDVVTNMGIKTLIQDFLIWQNDAKSLVMGVQWHTSMVGEQCGDSVRMVNIDTFGTKLSKPRNRLKIKLRRIVVDDATIEV